MKIIQLLFIQIGLGLAEDITSKLDYSVNAKRLKVYTNCLNACSADPRFLKDNFFANECSHTCRDEHDRTLEENIKQAGFQPSTQGTFDREEHVLYRGITSCHANCHNNKDPNDADATRRCVLGCEGKFTDGITKIKKDILGLTPSLEEQFNKEDNDIANRNRMCQVNCHKSDYLKTIVNGINNCVIECSQAQSTDRNNLLIKYKKPEAKSNTAFIQEQTKIFNKNHNCRSACVSDFPLDVAKQISCSNKCQKNIEADERELNKKYPQGSTPVTGPTQHGAIEGNTGTVNSLPANNGSPYSGAGSYGSYSASSAINGSPSTSAGSNGSSNTEAVNNDSSSTDAANNTDDAKSTDEADKKDDKKDNKKTEDASKSSSSGSQIVGSSILATIVAALISSIL